MNCAYRGDCDRVGDIIFSQEGASQTHRSVCKISRNTGIRQLVTPKQRSCLVANVFSDIEARQGGELSMHLEAS